MQSTLAYRNGNYLPKHEISIGIDDLGFERGFAVFDYCRERNGKIPFLNDHLKRLQHSQSILNFKYPASIDTIEKIILHLQEENHLINSYFKTIISGKVIHDSIEPVITIYQDNYVAYESAMYENGVSLIISEFAKPFPEYKTTFYLGALREFTRMKQNNAEDVLFYYDNIIRECSRCNIFIVKNHLIYTPDKNMLQGVTKKHVVACAKEKYIVIEKDITVKELFEADEVFISSTTKNMMPVVRIEDRFIADDSPGIITKDLMQMFALYCDNYEAGK
ncbi:MAG: aminotransferase class IV [Fimbriimonadaceae bacterium]|nr:aminotransferase class IV [Chitinophagales bacterium]